MIQWPSGARVVISLAQCGALNTIRREHYCLNCKGETCKCCGGRGTHRAVADWESQFKDYSVPTVSLLQACPKGHPYSEENTRWSKPGISSNLKPVRKCRACDRDAARIRSQHRRVS